MAKQKKLTMNDCYAELERVCRIITEKKIDEDELPFFRRVLAEPLKKIAEFRKIKEEEVEKKRLEKIIAERDRFYRGNVK